ncbi:MAG: ATP:cob(I)alamin adenosyltransferase, partial [Halobacteriaceae archaeon]
MSIYTGRGDEGMTDLWDMSRVPKTNDRIEVAGTVDE